MFNSEEALNSCKEVLAQRREHYKDINPFAEKVAKLWSTILGTQVTSEQFLCCMVALKIVRTQSSNGEEKRTQ